MPGSLLNSPSLLALGYDRVSGRLNGPGAVVERRLSDIRDIFAQPELCDRAISTGDPVIYRVQTHEPASGGGQLHCGIGILMPGRIGAEYYMTKGHLHSNRAAAEYYIGLSGSGAMLLEDERTGESQLLPLGKEQIVYVPGWTAHRTINTGAEPLVYLGIYPSDAGHDYAAIAERNFRMLVVEKTGRPALQPRS